MELVIDNNASHKYRSTVPLFDQNFVHSISQTRQKNDILLISITKKNI